MRRVTSGRSRLYSLILVAVLLLAPGVSTAEQLRVAVASNFADALAAIGRRFQAATQHRVVLSAGSTGKLYAQIRNGAPFGAFFGADVRRPQLLEEQGVAVPGSRFTYAVGRLVLWSPRPGYVDPEGRVLQRGAFRHLAIANPLLAPYGKAAQEVLQTRSLWQALSGRLVRGENIGQAYQFVSTGNAELGFIAWSQIMRPGQPLAGSSWSVPQALYSRIEQQAVLLQDKPVARDFLAFVRSDEALKIIQDYGYDRP
jgi:molybdate transport system substrate-binding protein